MQAITFPAFRKNRSAVQLKEVLAVIPDNQFTWSILDFNGVGEPPDDLSMDEFERKIRAQPAGFTMTWGELKEFSRKLNQTIDCLIIGARNGQDILDGQAAGDNFSSCEVVLSAFDSTEWSVWASDRALMDRFPSIF